jgi:ribose transport system ATP-binding protein
MAKILEARNLTKVYPGTVALNNFSAKFEAGKVHALLGKNGSGKSTFIKIISGAIQPTGGQLLIDDAALHFCSPKEAFDQGIATVYQELSLIPGLSIAENIFFGRLPKKNRYMIDYNKAYEDAALLLN